MSMAAAATSQSAVRRLQKDLQEVKEHPLLNVVGEPLENDLFQWHVNVRTCEEENEDPEETPNPLADVTFHLVLYFPSDFPMTGPTVYLCTPLPHPNVELNSARQVQLQISGHQLQNREDLQGLSFWKLSLWDCIPAYKGWSSAYSVQSVLLQLQTFLLREDLLYDVRKVQSLETAAQRARAFRCEICGHNAAKPFPPFATPADIANILRNKQKKLVSSPVNSLLKYGAKSPAVAQVVNTSPGPVPSHLHVKEAEKIRPTQPSSLPSESNSSSTGVPEADESDDWFTVGKKGRKARAKLPSEAMPKSQTPAPRPENFRNDPAVRVPGHYSQAVKEEKNQKLAFRSPVSAESHGRLSTVANAVAHEEETGYFGLLPQEPLTTILCLLPRDALTSLSLTCRGLKSACEDGYVWKTLMHRHFPATSLGAASIGDWKHAYMLEQSNILGSLRCFHTKCTHDEDVLGFPVSFTVNPRTKDVEYIALHLDILSESAYREGVRSTADNEKFTHLLPLYITEDHFQRALPLIQETAVELCPLLRGSGHHKVFHPDMVLDFMPKALNTMVVLLCDKGIQASERAIEGYCMLHRLFLALCEKFHLRAKAEQAVIKFNNSPENRVKKSCPDLGRLIARMSVCDSAATSWSTIVRPLTAESLDRNVLWICKNNPPIAENFRRAAADKSQAVDEELLLAAWDGSKVSLRLNLFHAAFLNMIARPPKVPSERIIAGYDMLYGMPSAYLKNKMWNFIKSVLEIGYDWPSFFRLMGMACPSKAYLTGWLGQCWNNSLQKGYHNNQTRFQNIQKRGVSKILLKGESYTAPPNLKSAEMFETWRYENHVQYLDASCLVYDFKGKFLELVDFSHLNGAGGAITHSGDIINQETREGKHIISISFAKLGSIVRELYFTMSGYRGATLKGFRLPFVQLKDTATEMELCRYTLEDKDLGSHRSVIMCRMYRASKDSHKWEVQALGSLGDGAAEDYEPLKARISDLIAKRN